MSEKSVMEKDGVTTEMLVVALRSYKKFSLIFSQRDWIYKSDRMLDVLCGKDKEAPVKYLAYKLWEQIASENDRFFQALSFILDLPTQHEVDVACEDEMIVQDAIRFVNNLLLFEYSIRMEKMRWYLYSETEDSNAILLKGKVFLALDNIFHIVKDFQDICITSE